LMGDLGGEQTLAAVGIEGEDKEPPIGNNIYSSLLKSEHA